VQKQSVRFYVMLVGPTMADYQMFDSTYDMYNRCLLLSAVFALTPERERERERNSSHTGASK